MGAVPPIAAPDGERGREGEEEKGKSKRLRLYCLVVGLQWSSGELEVCDKFRDKLRIAQKHRWLGWAGLFGAVFVCL